MPVYPSLIRRFLPYAIGAVLACKAGESGPAGESTFALQVIATGSGDSVDMGRPLIVRSGHGGRVYVAVQRISGLAMVLDSAANLIRVIGSAGSGPGEFSYVSQLYPKGDSVAAGDLRGDASLFGPDGRFVRSLKTKVTTVGQVLNLRGDTLLVPEPIMTAERFGHPLQLLGPNGDTVRSFGSEDRSFDRRVMSRMYRVVAAATDSTVWVARIDRYQVERWHMNGTLLQTITNVRPWFPALEKDWDGTTAERYPTILKQIHQDRDGHLLVLLERARPDFTPTGITTSQESGKTLALSDRLEFMEQVIEVLDAKTGELKGTIFDRRSYLINFLDDDRVVGISTDSDGREFPSIFRVFHPPTNQ